jgi:hypothetical protein
VGGKPHCEPQGDKLMQFLVTPANFRHHAKSNCMQTTLSSKATNSMNAYSNYVSSLRARFALQLQRSLPSSYSLSDEHMHVHMHEIILNASARPAFLPAMLPLVA